MLIFSLSPHKTVTECGWVLRMHTSENRGMGLFRRYHYIRYGMKDFLVIFRDSYTEITFIALTRSCEQQS
jgi:hypothetical protein